MPKQQDSPKRYTRDEIMAMARHEYARQLSLYTKAQLTKYSANKPSVTKTPSNTATTPSARIVC
ncbi:hypothetical protein A0J61_00613 [Choanephora cucurbitarum]|uniref:Uncharacterized protein n=1 Tax=Choanephora cucurbitarum TaxID=101091 RepID=A0A1C7NQH8_9FUNG|nr:hypothetical protein A0J61_00613 [Choanephora cucurbitarum]